MKLGVGEMADHFGDVENVLGDLSGQGVFVVVPERARKTSARLMPPSCK